LSLSYLELRVVQEIFPRQPFFTVKNNLWQNPELLDERRPKKSSRSGEGEGWTDLAFAYANAVFKVVADLRSESRMCLYYGQTLYKARDVLFLRAF
jgi:hypothetical protein